MPASKEFAILMEDRPGTLGKICRSLADRNVSILAFQSVPLGGKSLVRLFVDNPPTARDVLTAERVMLYTRKTAGEADFGAGVQCGSRTETVQARESCVTWCLVIGTLVCRRHSPFCRWFQ
jgi:hypothetical protein